MSFDAACAWHTLTVPRNDPPERRAVDDAGRVGRGSRAIHRALAARIGGAEAGSGQAADR